MASETDPDELLSFARSLVVGHEAVQKVVSLHRFIAALLGTLEDVRLLCSDDSEAARKIDAAMESAKVRLGRTADDSGDVSVDETIALTQAVSSELPEHRLVMRGLIAELLWRRAWNGLVPLKIDETIAPPGWEPCRENPGWFRKKTFRAVDEVMDGYHFSRVRPVESHPPDRAWNIYLDEHPHPVERPK